MKLILDFDDVLFNNTKQFKERMFSSVAKQGIPRIKAEEYYKKIRVNQFSLKNFLTVLFNGEKAIIRKVYKEIMKKCPDFLNKKLIELVKKIGKRDCYLVSTGDKEFQHEKIKKSGTWKLFTEVRITTVSKKDFVEEICEKNKGGKVIFVDDKAVFFADLNMKRYPNLKTVLYDKDGYKKLLTLLKSGGDGGN